MTVVVVTAQNIRLDDAEVITDWGNIGGGPGGSLETDFFYQNANCVARKGASAARGFFLSDNVNSDISGGGTHNTVIFKLICTTPGLLDAKSTPAFFVSIGSGSIPATPSIDFHTYHLHGNDTYPIKSSWLIVPIDPNVVAHRNSTTGTPDLTIADYYALEYDQSGVSKSPNQGVDAVDIGDGLTLVSGDGADPDGLWSDFVSLDEGTVANRFGYVTTFEDIIFVVGKLIIGNATATVFNDSGQTLVFPDGLFATGFSAIEIGLNSASTDVDFTTSNFFGNGVTTPEDTRPLLTVTSTSGAFDATDCAFDAFGIITLTSGATLTRCTFTNSEQILQVGGTIDDCTIASATIDNAFGAVKIFDDSLSAFEDETTDANDQGDADWQIFGTLTEATDDYIALGFQRKFNTVIFDNANGTAGIDGGSLAAVWEYFNGSTWSSLASVTDGTASGGLAFTAAVSDGQTLTYTEPTDWATTILDSSASLYYIRLRITAGDYSTNPVYDQGFIENEGVAFIQSDDPGLISDCDFTFSQRHAIEMTATGTYTFGGNTFTGYGVAGSDDAAVFNSSGGLITLNLAVGDSSPTVRNSSGSSTTVNNNVTATVTVKDEAGAVIVGARVSIRLDSDNSEILGGDTNGSGVVTGSVAANAGAVSVRVRKGSGSGTDYVPVRSSQTIGAANFDVTVTMAEDTNNAT